MSEQVRRISPDEMQLAQPTPGIVRHVADESEHHWFGHARAEANTMSGWHHHGDNTTVGYVLTGELRLEFGPGGHEQADIAAGDYFVVPPNTIHREGNATDSDGEAIIVRFGDGPPVFPADGPEPA